MAASLAFSTAEPTARRLPLIDGLRGVALLAMAFYHGSWDLDFLGLADFDLLGNPLWLLARTVILGSFLMLAGVSLVLATEHGLDRARFLRRLALLAAAAGAVSAASYLMFPQSPIFFGVLHHMAVASVLGLAFLRLPWFVTLAAAVAVIVAGKTLTVPLFDAPWLRWIGLMSFEPDSNDYVPLFPWFGGVLIGIALGRLWRSVATGSAGPIPSPSQGEGQDEGVPKARRAAPSPNPLPWGERASFVRPFAWAGRHSLAIYLIHQPLLFGTLWLVAQGIGIDPPEVRDFMGSCTASCTGSGGEAPLCAASCRCIVDDLGRRGLWVDFLNDRLDAAGRTTVDAAVRFCGQRL